jgi:hypothetical protein
MFINRSGSPFTVLDEDAGATAGNRIRTGTGASITLTNNASILLSYAGDSRWHVVGGTGSSSAGGAKNYFAISSANPNFSQNSVSPWSACTLTFTSGVPSAAPTLTATQMAIAATATNPLLQSQSNYNLQLTKSAANAQYQGFISGELTIDREDLAKVLTGSFSYEVASGTVDFSGTSTQSLEIWVYNTVSGAWTQPAGFRGMNTSSGTGVVSFTFQTDSTAANNKYKIAVITQQTSATAYSVNFNDFSVGPTAVINGTPITDWQSYTPTTAGLGTISSVNMFWRRVGSNLEVMGNLTTGTVTAVEAQIGLPAGITSTSNISTIQQAGLVILGAVTSNVRNLLIETSKTYLTVGIANATSQLTKQLGTTFANTIVLSFQASIPVQGWSSNVQVSSDTDTRVCSTIYTSTSTAAVTANTTNITYAGLVADTHSSWSGTVFTAPISGFYRVSASSYSLTAHVACIFKEGSKYSSGSLGSSSAPSVVTATVQLNAGQTLSIRSDTSVTLANTVQSAILCIERISGPSVVAASETVTASYSVSAGASTADTVQFNFDTKTWDSHNAVTTGAGVWKFTAPISGTYFVSATLYLGGTNSNVALYKNGSIFRSMAGPFGATASNQTAPGSTLVQLNAGDYIDIRNVSTAARTPATTAFTGATIANCNFVNISRVGN